MASASWKASSTLRNYFFLCPHSQPSANSSEEEAKTRASKSEGKSHEASVEQCSRNNNLENTHLVLQEATGRKYNAAIQWGVPAVTAQ